jgi:hypothetical protein
LFNIADTPAADIPIFDELDSSLNVKALLSDRDILQQLDSKDIGSGYLAKNMDPTARRLREQRRENFFVFRPKQRCQPVIRQFQIEQEYLGTVVAINPNENTFTARLTDLKGSDADEEGEFSIDELNDDEHLVVPGAVFTWTIGLQSRGPCLQRLRVSDLRFRRYPPITNEVIAKAEKEAKELSAFLCKTELAEPFIGSL